MVVWPFLLIGGVIAAVAAAVHDSHKRKQSATSADERTRSILREELDRRDAQLFRGRIFGSPAAGEGKPAKREKPAKKEKPAAGDPPPDDSGEKGNE